MPHEDDDFFDIDSIFGDNHTEKKKTVEDDDFQPIGLGRKSRYAVHRAMPDDRIRSVEVDPELAVSARTAQSEKPVKKKPTAAGPRKTPLSQRVRENAAQTRETAGEAISYFMDSSGQKKEARKARAENYEKRIASRKQTGKAASVKSSPPVKRRKPAKKRSFREELLSFLYLGAMAVGGLFRLLFGSRRRVAVTAAVVSVCLILWGVSSAVTLYKSNTAFADQGKDIDQEAIIERKVTEAENRNKVTYFLIAGVDKSSRLTDCIWVMCLDNQKHRMEVLQIPRDTYVGDDSIAPHKFNAVYESPKTVNWCEKCGQEVADEDIDSSTGRHLACGQEVGTKKESNMNALIRVINNRLKLPVDHYILFDFKGFEKVVDAMGGVDIVLEKEMRVYPNKKDFVTLDAGFNHLDGATALKFMRNRKIYADGDLGRVKAQRQLIHAMMEKVDDMSVVTAFNVLMAAKDYFKTDMSVDDITSFISPVKKCSDEGLHMFELPGKAGTRKGRSYYFCDEEKAAEALNEYMLPYSEKLTAEDIDFPER